MPKVYAPEAKRAGQYLSYKPWRDCSTQGLQLLTEQGGLPGCDPARVSIRRSAKHSHFPECTTCHGLRERYFHVVQQPGADPAEVKAAEDGIIEHNNKWGSDRRIALSMKYETYQQYSDTCVRV